VFVPRTLHVVPPGRDLPLAFLGVLVKLVGIGLRRFPRLFDFLL
jgi:hypothetical protein